MKERGRARTRPIDVVVFGEAIWDLFPRRPGERVGGRAIDVRHPGGAPANVARTLARLGVSTSLVTAVGADPLGEGLIARIAADGVEVRDVVKLAARTAITFVDVAADGARSFLFYRHPSADMLLTPEMLRPDAFDARWLHLGSSTFARAPSREASLHAWALARARGARLSLDVNARAHLWPTLDELRAVVLPLVREAALVKVSEEDLGVLGLSPDEGGGRALHALRDGRTTILTLAARGAVAWSNDEVIRAKAPRARVVDVTGAGDAFTAGALATLVHHDREDAAALARALSVGCVLGTRATTRLGATAALTDLRPIRSRLRAALAAHPAAAHRSLR